MTDRAHPLRGSLRLRLTFWAFGLLLLWAIVLAAILHTSLVSLTVEVPMICRVDPDTNAPDCPPPTYRVIRARPTIPDTVATLRDMGPLSVGALLATLALAALATYWIAGRTLAPVRSIGRAASGIDIDNLDAHLGPAHGYTELAAVSRAFDAMLDRLRDGVARERRFISDASHELRTPLAVMRTNLEVVRDDPEATTEDYRVMAARLERSVTRLERLTESLLVLAGGDALPSAFVPLDSLIEDVLADIGDLACERGVQVERESTSRLAVHGDEALLRRAIGNLLENALRYAPAGGRVCVRTCAAANQVRVEVEDSGPGIPESDIPFVFDRLWRGDRSRSRAQGGAGLGLALVKEIVERHDGSVSVRSVIGAGTTFTVTLPEG